MLIFKIRIERQQYNLLFSKYYLNNKQLNIILKESVRQKKISIYLISIRFHTITFNSRTSIKDQNNKLAYYL